MNSGLNASNPDPFSTFSDIQGAVDCMTRAWIPQIPLLALLASTTIRAAPAANLRRSGVGIGERRLRHRQCESLLGPGGRRFG
jgi:hypothetical protein